MIYQVFWRHKDIRETHYGFVSAYSRDNAYDIVTSRLADGFYVTAVYEARVNHKVRRYQ